MIDVKSFEAWLRGTPAARLGIEEEDLRAECVKLVKSTRNTYESLGKIVEATESQSKEMEQSSDPYHSGYRHGFCNGVQRVAQALGHLSNKILLDTETRSRHE